MVYTHLDLKMLDEALHGPNAKEWEEALKYEINQLEKLGMWVVEDLPLSQSAIPCSKVVWIKCSPDGEVQSYRVRIVARGHRQVEGVNYTKIFSAAMKMPTICVFLTNAAHQDGEIEHINIKSAYLNAPLKEATYMKAPRGVLKPGQEGKVLSLLKGLYGLKQPGRGWYMEMAGVFMNELGLKRSTIDHLVFCWRTGEEHIIVAVVTDNMAVTLKRSVDAECFKLNVKCFWDIMDHEPIKWFLGFEIRRDWKLRTVLINQQAYIKAMVDKFRLILDEAMPFNHQSSCTHKRSACEAIGLILCPTIVSQLDTAYAVGILLQFIQNPGQTH